MKRFLFLAALLLISITSISQDVLPAPTPAKFVTDEAKLLSPIQQEDLEKRLVAFADSTTIQLAIVTIPSLNGTSIEAYALKLFNSWGIGQKNKNNGLLILVAAKDRKVRIEVGRGLEKYVTDAKAAEIIKTDIVPLFKQGKHYTGLLKAVCALCMASLPSVKEEAERAQQEKAAASPGFSPDFRQPEVSAGAKWGLGGAIFAGFFALLGGISWLARFLLPNGWNYGRHHHLNDAHYYNTDNSFTSSDSSSSDPGSSSTDFGGGDSGGSGSSDTW